MKKRRTSEIGTTSLQGTKAISPKRPFLRGSTVLWLSPQYCMNAYVVNKVQERQRQSVKKM